MKKPKRVKQKCMRILLISPCIDEHKKTNKQLMMPQLALYILEGLTPDRHEVEIIEEEVRDIDLDAECDVVGISCMTANAPRAYHLAEEFRKRGRKVVLGGVHPTILPDEALQYADSVVVGEAEGVWEKLLDDVEKGTLQRKYYDGKPDLATYVPKDYSKILNKRLFNLVPIMTTRGCPYNCDFCCVTDLFGKKIRHIPIGNVMRDIVSSGGKNFMFLDDNIIGHPRYAKELFRAIAPLKINWVGQASISLVKDTEMMELAARSGCKGLFFGLETVSEQKMKSFRKTFRKIADLEAALKKIKDTGILIHASMIFGFDDDGPDIFDDTVDFLIRNKVSTVSFNILTPYPGTRTYTDMLTSGRLLTNDWRYFDHNTVVYRPVNMPPQVLQDGKTRAKKRFYGLSSVMKRFSGNLYSPLIYLATNMGHMKQVRKEEVRNVLLKAELFDGIGPEGVTQGK